MSGHWKKLIILPPTKLAKTEKKCYILEVDVEYPVELHTNHNELSFLAEKMKTGKLEKLLPNLKDKKMYIVHIKNFDQELKLGL